jgi:hypothetical protein
MEERRVRWASDTALFARVFEAWTEETLAREHSCESPYLVTGTAADARADHSLHPTGLERDVLFSMLDRLFHNCGPELHALSHGSAVVPEAILRLMPFGDFPAVAM